MRNLTKPFGVFLASCIVLSQFFLVINLKNKWSSNGRKNNHAVNHDENQEPIPEFDEAQFRFDVAIPHDEMVKKFPNHPNIVLSKLTKELVQETEKTKTMQEEVNEVRKMVGMPIPNPPIGSGDPNQCPAESPLLLGQVHIMEEFEELEPNSPEFIKWYGPNIRPGGTHKPTDCVARQKVAIIIPYRDRPEHLKIFLHHLHPILQRQQLNYRLIVVEQSTEEDFNRAALLNIGFTEAMKYDDYVCLVMHDVDLLPEDDRNLYLCPSGDAVKHLNVAVNKWQYKLQYKYYVGGVTAISTEVFKKINGFSNTFYGWGGEDDDLSHRMKVHNISIQRDPADISRFGMLSHGKVEMNSNLNMLMDKSKNSELDSDGLSTLQFELLDKKEYPLYTWLLVKLPNGPEKTTKSWWDIASNSLMNRVNNLAGSMAVNIAAGMEGRKPKELPHDTVY